MGRAEKRAYERMQKKTQNRKTVTLSMHQVRNLRRDAVDGMGAFDVEILMTCFATVLHEKFGFEYKQIDKAIGAVDDMFGLVLEDKLSPEEMRNNLFDKTGIAIHYSKNWG